MSSKLYAFLLTSFAGLSTLIGFIFVFIKSDSNKVLSKALGFTSGIMLTISIIDLIPNSLCLIIKNSSIILSIILILISFIMGIIISNSVDKNINKSKKHKINLYKLGIITMIVIILHNIPEGIITYITASNNAKLGLSLAIAIAFHNIPEGIAISVPIYYSTNSKFKAFLYTFISAISEPIGSIIAYIFLSKFINSVLLGMMYLFIAGMMINISYNELLEAKKYNKKSSIIYFIIGIFLMIINHLLLN